MIFFPSSASRPKATDTAAQLGPIAAPTDTDHSSEYTRPISSPTLPVNSGIFLRPTKTASSSRPKSYESGSPVDQFAARPFFDLQPSGKPKTTRADIEDSQVQSPLLQSPLLSPHFDYPKKRSPELLEAINNNGLVIFLLVSTTKSGSSQLLRMRRQMS
jgi:hypothetical protein